MLDFEFMFYISHCETPVLLCFTGQVYRKKCILSVHDIMLHVVWLQVKLKLFKLIKHTLRLGVKGFVGVAVDSDINFPIITWCLQTPHFDR